MKEQEWKGNRMTDKEFEKIEQCCFEIGFFEQRVKDILNIVKWYMSENNLKELYSPRQIFSTLKGIPSFICGVSLQYEKGWNLFCLTFLKTEVEGDVFTEPEPYMKEFQMTIEQKTLLAKVGISLCKKHMLEKGNWLILDDEKSDKDKFLEKKINARHTRKFRASLSDFIAKGSKFRPKTDISAEELNRINMRIKTMLNE